MSAVFLTTWCPHTTLLNNIGLVLHNQTFHMAYLSCHRCPHESNDLKEEIVKHADQLVSTINWAVIWSITHSVVLMSISWPCWSITCWNKVSVSYIHTVAKYPRSRSPHNVQHFTSRWTFWPCHTSSVAGGCMYVHISYFLNRGLLRIEASWVKGVNETRSRIEAESYAALSSAYSIAI